MSECFFNGACRPRPIFVVGSPRSGTSILTWCLGQHPNILPVEESNWLDKFAVELGSTYALGAQRGGYSELGALGISRGQFYEWFGHAIHELIHARARQLMREDAQNPKPTDEPFRWWRSDTDPKQRWVDGTPEYSMSICALLKLFPEAKFVHIVRDVHAVVKSMLRFPVAGPKLVGSEGEAYAYWLRTTRACLRAERAFGSDRIRRIRYADLVENGEGTLRRVLEFLEEPYSPDCLRPLARRINSSNVPVEFDPRDAATPRELIEQAERLSGQLQAESTAAAAASAEERSALEEEFEERVKYIGTLEKKYDKSREQVAQLEKELSERARWANELDRTIHVRDQTIQELQRELTAIGRWAHQLNEEIAKRDELIRQLRHHPSSTESRSAGS